MERKIQEIRSRIVGPVNSIPTTFTKTGEIDWPGIGNVIETGIAGGSGVSLLTYGDSQFDFLTDQEVAELTRFLAERVAGRAIAVAATKRWWTSQAVEFARYCRALGIDLLMMLPSDHVGTEQGKVEWYKAAAREIPVMLVGAPSHRILDGLLDEPRVCAFKEDGTIEYALQTIVKYAGRWEIVSGGGYLRHFTLWPYGCRAFFSFISSFAPDVVRRYWKGVQAGDGYPREFIASVEMPWWELAASYYEGWQDVWRGALELNGIAQRYLRPPRRSLTDAEMQALAPELRKIGLLT